MGPVKKTKNTTTTTIRLQIINCQKKHTKDVCTRRIIPAEADVLEL